MQRTAVPETTLPSSNGAEEASRRSHGRTVGPKKGHPIRNTLIVLAIVGAVTVAVLRIISTRQAAAEKQAGPAKGGFPVPVVAGTVQQKDVPIYLDGLGTIQALNTVTVRARVDGQIEKLAFTEGDEVKAGDLLAQIDPAPFQAALDQALARQKQDEVQLGNAKADLERYADLIQKKVISQQQYDTQKALVAQFEAAVTNDRAAVTSANVQLGYTKIVSPIAGRTGIRLVDAGNIVHASDQNGLVVITQLRPIALIFTLPEQTLVDIHNTQEKTQDFQVMALARDNKTVLGQGKLTVIDNQIDSATGTIRMKAEFPNENNELWPGQFVNARLLLTTRQGGLIVPASVVQRGPDGAYAYVIQDDMKVQMRPIKVAQVDSGEALIEDGLHAGERVVVDGQYKLQSSSTVKIAESPGHTGGARPNGAEGPRPVEKSGAPGDRKGTSGQGKGKGTQKAQ